MFDIKDKIFLITGAAAGIGASVVRALLEEDIKHIAILDIDDKNGFSLAEELNAIYGSNKVNFIKCDVTQEQELLNAFETVISEQGYIDVVINSAGILNDKYFDKEIEVNLTASVRSSLRARDLMRKDEGGRGGTVINIASIAGISHFFAVPVYSATKSAVLKFSTTLGDQVHYSKTGVRVLTICFGLTKTEMVNDDKFMSFDLDFPRMIKEAMASVNCQTSENAAQGLIEVYKAGASGSVWVVTSGKPAVDVTDKYVQSTQLFDDIVFS